MPLQRNNYTGRPARVINFQNGAFVMQNLTECLKLGNLPKTVDTSKLKIIFLINYDG